MEFKLPELGEGVHEGELVKWRVKAGDTVNYDQVLLEVMTDKATMEVPSPFKGTVTSLGAKEGQTIHVGQTLVTYEGVGGQTHAPKNDQGPKAAKSEAPAAATPKAEAPKSAPAPSKAPAAPTHSPAMSAAPAQNLSTVSGSSAPNDRTLASPGTRRLARELGVELSNIPASGPNGRVLREDIERAARLGQLMPATFGNKGNGATAAGMPSFANTGMAAAPTKASTKAPANSAMGAFAVPAATFFAGEREKSVPFIGLRKKISERMRQSKDHAAHFTFFEEADATALVELRNQAKDIGAAQGIKVTYLPFVMKAMVAALRQYPIMNSTLDEATGQLIYKNYYNIGISIQTADGLMAPVVKDVENKTVFQIAADIQGLVERARNRKLVLEDLQGSTITLTNAGSIGGLFATPIINYPEVAILGLNKIFRKPVVKQINGREEIVVRDWTYFSLSLDHRVVDGAIGAEFTNLFVKYIENPGLLFLS